MRFIQPIMLALACGLVLVACGGGGGGGSAPPPAPPPPPPPVLLTQTISFVDPGIIDRALEQGDFTNTASGGAGTGAITYASSATSVATVDATTGAVTVIAPGIAEITAAKAADAVYASATRSYAMIIQRPAGVPFTASVSHAGAEVEFPAWARANYTGRRFSPRRNAGFLSFEGSLWMVGGIDDFGPRSDVWTSPDGEFWSVRMSGTIPYPGS